MRGIWGFSPPGLDPLAGSTNRPLKVPGSAGEKKVAGEEEQEEEEPEKRDLRNVQPHNREKEHRTPLVAVVAAATLTATTTLVATLVATTTTITACGFRRRLSLHDRNTLHGFIGRSSKETANLTSYV